MTSITWIWKDFWRWYEQVEDIEIQFDALRQIHTQFNIPKLSAEAQADLFLHAPLEFKQEMKNFPKLYKREAILILEMDLNKKSKAIRSYRR